jgi:hypothetical protein
MKEPNMKDEKVLMNFRFTKDQKRQFEYLAEKSGNNITRYIELLLKGEIETTLVIEAHTAAIETAAIKLGIDPKMANAIANSTDRSHKLDQIETLLNNGDRFKFFLDEFEKAWWETLEARFLEFAIETPLTGTRMDFYGARRYVKTY